MSATVGVRATVIGNAQLIVIPDHTIPTCRIDVGFAGGGRLDPVGHKGAHRVMAELLVRGTENKPRKEFNRRLEHMGSTLTVAWAT
ncbi:MAG: hypothetical protein AAF658_22305, partial [Myxococcota bacterium]